MEMEHLLRLWIIPMASLGLLTNIMIVRRQSRHAIYANTLIVCLFLCFGLLRRKNQNLWSLSNQRLTHSIGGRIC